MVNCCWTQRTPQRHLRVPTEPTRVRRERGQGVDECWSPEGPIGPRRGCPPFGPDKSKGDDDVDNPGVDICGAETGWGGTFNFRGLVEGGFLDESGQPLQGIHYRYDECSQTPYVYNATSHVMVSFDDAKSFEAKGQFIEDQGLRGFMMWQANSDYKDILIDSIRQGGGYDD